MLILNNQKLIMQDTPVILFVSCDLLERLQSSVRVTLACPAGADAENVDLCEAC